MNRDYSHPLDIVPTPHSFYWRPVRRNHRSNNNNCVWIFSFVRSKLIAPFRYLWETLYIVQYNDNLILLQTFFFHLKDYIEGNIFPVLEKNIIFITFCKLTRKTKMSAWHKNISILLLISRSSVLRHQLFPQLASLGLFFRQAWKFPRIKGGGKISGRFWLSRKQSDMI